MGIPPEYRVIEKVLKKKLIKLGIYNTFKVSWYNSDPNRNLIIYVKGYGNKYLWELLVKKILNDLLPFIFCDRKIYCSSVSIRFLK